VYPFRKGAKERGPRQQPKTALLVAAGLLRVCCHVFVAVRYGKLDTKLSVWLVQERKDGLMRDLSAPTRKRLSELGVVRMRSKAGLDLERGGDEHSSGETPHLRGQHGSTQFSGEADDEARDTVGSSLDVAGGFDPDMPPPPGQMREWDALSGRSPSMVRFAAHTRSASGTTYPLQR
jgi:hypothetical protein